MFRKLLLLLCLLVPTSVHAEWFEARSPNFIVYSQGSGEDARDFAIKLERYDFVLRTAHKVNAPPASNPLRVFLMQNVDGVREMAGAPGSSIAGYYMSNARALMLVGTRNRLSGMSADIRTAGQEVELDPETILLHEYAHHFMYQYFPAAYPTWYSEGFAEFWGTTRLLPNDVVDVGLPADHRFSTFRDLGWLPVQRMMKAHNYGELAAADVFLLYAEGWLVLRYVFEHPQRRRQLDQYLALVNRGTSYEDAARQAFPDLDKFNSELYEYAGTGRFNYIRLPFKTRDLGTIAVRKLRPAEQALMTREIKLSQGIAQRDAAEFARDVRGSASRFPDDPFALRLLMESEWLAGNKDAALTAADRLLKVEPNHARATVTKARLQLAALRAAGSTDAQAWSAARQLLARSIALAPNDPTVLESYYDSFADQGMMATEEAQNALYTAMELAPSDGELRYKLARDFELRNMIPEAIAIIRPEAFSSPHTRDESEKERKEREKREERNREAGKARHETAREMLARLEAKLAETRRAPAPAGK